MPAPPLRTALANTYPNPTNAVARTGFGALWDYVTTLLGSTGDAAEARVALGALGYGGGTLTGVLNEAQSANIAASGTLNLQSATGNLVDVTGTTPITVITLAQGAERTVRLVNGPTLTHGANLVLPGSANIVATPGDFAVFRGYAAGVVRCVGYQRANGTAVTVEALDYATADAAGLIELATVAETAAGVDNARAATPAGVAAKVANAISGIPVVDPGLGSGQTWQAVTGSRAIATNYTNDTGKPIAVHLVLTAIPNITDSYAQVVIAGSVILRSANLRTSGEVQTLSFVVPNGATYNVTLEYVSGISYYVNLTSWHELR